MSEHRPDSIDYLLSSVKSRGLRLANLFEYQTPAGDWRWQANLTDGAKSWEFGRGPDAPTALRAALFASATEAGVVITHRQPTPQPTSQVMGASLRSDPAPRTQSSKLRI